MKTSAWVFLIACFATQALCWPAYGGVLGLVVNGDFEEAAIEDENDPDFPIPTWVDFGGDDLGLQGIQTLVFHGPDQAAIFGSTSDPSGIYQDLNTTAGFTYTVKFWLKVSQGEDFAGAPLDPDNLIIVRWDNTVIFQAQNLLNSDFVEIVRVPPEAVASTSRLTFEFRNLPGFFYLDDVSVTRLDTNAVPEPTSLAAWSLAALGLGLLRRRQKVAA